MKSVSDKNIFEKNKGRGSVYGSITLRYISKPFAFLLMKLGIHNSNSVIVVSFLLLLSSSISLTLLKKEIFFNRIIIALLIEIIFILDCSKEQITGASYKKSFVWQWLEIYLKKIGEMVLYTVIGFVVWREQGHFIYFLLGLSTGFLFTYHTIMFSVKDSVVYNEIEKNDFNIDRISNENSKNHEKIKSGIMIGENILKNNIFSRIIEKAFYYLNFGTGERYFFLILFILLNRMNIMLVFLFAFNLFRVGSAALMLSRRIMKSET